MIERQASEVPNQPGPHAEACLAALQRAFAREWGVGEPRMMASFHYALGTLHDPRLVEEQLRELRALQKLVKPQTRDHLLITNDLANVMFWSYHQRDPAIQEMQAEVADYLRANEGQWPYEDNEILGNYVRLFEGARRYAAGEEVLLARLTATKNLEQRKWLEQRLLQLYNEALAQKGTVSLGSGDLLLSKAVDLAVERIESSNDDNRRYNLFTRVMAHFEAAETLKLASRQAKLQTFVFDTIPQILKRQTSNYRNTATHPVGQISITLGHKAALRYVVERLEQYPQRLEMSWERAWDGFGSSLAHHRHEAAGQGENLADLEPRVLKLAIAELKRHLRTGEQRSPDIYDHHYPTYWRAKQADFAKTAEEMWDEQNNSGRRAVSVANYLRHGLDFRPRSIEILMIAYEKGILDTSGIDTLVTYLHEDQRYAESIPILQKQIVQWPDNMQHRVLMMTAYHRTLRPQQMMDLLAATDAHFHKEGRWSEGHIAQLAGGCLGCGLHEQAAGYFKEAIAQRQRNQGGVTLGDSTLSSWYQQLASAYWRWATRKRPSMPLPPRSFVGEHSASSGGMRFSRCAACWSNRRTSTRT